MLLVNINDGRIFMGVILSGYYIYVVGGYFFWNILDLVEYYEWLGNKWCYLLLLYME